MPIEVSEEAELQEFQDLHRQAVEKIREELQARAVSGEEIIVEPTGYDEYAQMEPATEPDMYYDDIGYVISSVRTTVRERRRPWRWLFGLKHKVRQSTILLSTTQPWGVFSASYRKMLFVDVRESVALAPAQKFFKKIGDTHGVKVTITRRYPETVATMTDTVSVAQA